MTKDEKTKLLKTYHFQKSIENLLLPQLEDNVIGLCAAFIGNEGTSIKYIIEQITDFLYKIGKIKDSKVREICLAETDLEFSSNYAYSVISLADRLDIEKRLELKGQKNFVNAKKISFNKNDKENRKLFFNGLELLISQYRQKYIFINCNEQDYKNFINTNSKLSFIFSDIITIRDITNLEIADVIYDELISKKIIENGEEKELSKTDIKAWLEKNRYNFPFENRELAFFVSNYMNFHKNVFPKSVMRTDSAQKALDEIVGLDLIKSQINDLKQYLQFKYRAEKEGIKLPNQSLHMVFLGNAGTGKTTIARIVAQILYEIGICKENKVIEVSRKDLVAEFLGQTAPKTAKVVESAMNGVLFIDEAYSLCSLNGSINDMYGAECISTLIKLMEDNKDRLVVIFAGYSKEMKTFLNSNSGIASRIGYTFDFPDYTVKELLKIYQNKMSSFKLTEQHLREVEKLITYFHSLKNAGNGRLIDKIIQNVLIRHSKNENELLILDNIDVPTISEMGETIYSDSVRFVFPEMISEEDYKKTAIHELGHALISYVLSNDSGIDKITISPEASGTLGYVKYKEEKDIVHANKQYYKDRICRLLGGRAAEEVFLGINDISGGCSSDIEKCTNICCILAETGQSNTFGLVCAGTMFEKSEISKLMFNETKEILDMEYERAKEILMMNKNTVNEITQILLKEKILEGEDINKYFKQFLKK